MQESLASEHLDSGGVFPVLVLPVVPFITKFNRYIVLGLLVVGKFGNNFKAIPDGFQRKGQLHLQGVSCWVCEWKWSVIGGYGAGLPGGGALVRAGLRGRTKRGISRVVKHVDV